MNRREHSIAAADFRLAHAAGLNQCFSASKTMAKTTTKTV